MKFSPKKEEDLSSFPLLPEGEYKFEVVSALDKISEAGNEMIQINVKINTDSGPFLYLNDYLLEKLHYKLKHFCDCVGLKASYLQGELNASLCDGKSGTLIVGIQKDKLGVYPDKNIVKDYIVSESVNSDEFINDELPF